MVIPLLAYQDLTPMLFQIALEQLQLIAKAMIFTVEEVMCHQ